MPLSFLTKQKGKGSLTLLVDIGSSSVGASLVLIEKDRAPHIVSSVRENISFQEAFTSARFLSVMTHTLDKVLKAVQVNLKNYKKVNGHSGESPEGSIEHVYCTLSSPWFILKSRHLHVSRGFEFEVTDEVLNEFIDEDLGRLKEELKKTLPPEDLRIIERKVIQMKLNGYEIKNPYGQKTSKMELSVVVGVSSGKAMDSIERKLRNFFHAKTVHFGAFPIAAFSAIRDIFATEKNFFFVDITGEAADVTLVTNDLMMGTISFARGKNYFIREISTKLHTVHEEAASLFGMYLRNELASPQKEKIAAIVAHAEGEWLLRFEKSAATLTESRTFPRKIFFTADADISTLFSSLLTRSRSEFLSGATFNLQYLDQLIVAKFVSFEPEVIRDPFIVIEALFAKKLVEQHI